MSLKDFQKSSLVHFLLGSICIHLVLFFVFYDSSPKKPKKIVRSVTLIPRKFILIKKKKVSLPKLSVPKPKVRKKAKPKRRKKIKRVQVNRRKHRKYRKRKRRRRFAKKFLKKRKRRKRLALKKKTQIPKQAVPFESSRTKKKKQKNKLTRTMPKSRKEGKIRSKTSKVPNYRGLNLGLSTGALAGRRSQRGRSGSKNGAWAGKSHFARSMRAYHKRWKEMIKEQAGLTDMYFAEFAKEIDRCVEIWAGDNFPRILRRSVKTELKWTGIFHVTWSVRGKIGIRLGKSTGPTYLRKAFLKSAVSCAKRARLPKRLAGKKLFASLAALARAIKDLKPFIGLAEQRDPRNGNMYWTPTYPGKIYVVSNTILIRAVVKP